MYVFLVEKRLGKGVKANKRGFDFGESEETEGIGRVLA